MVNVMLEIIKKELSSYYGYSSTIVRNILFLAIFGALTIYQLTQVVAHYGASAHIIASGLDVLLALAAIFPVNMASGISVMAFPVERDQKTLEHLLSLPLSDSEIFLGKFIAAVIAGLTGLALIYVVIFGFIFMSYNVSPADLFASGSMSLMAFVICPLLVVLLILGTVAISSHISARETYIVNLFTVFVLLGLNIAVASLNMDAQTIDEILIVVLVPAIVIMYVIGTRSFNRESLIKSL